MSKRAIWITVAVIAFVAAATLTVFALMAPGDTPEPTPTSTATPSPTMTPTPTPTPTSTPTPSPTPTGDAIAPTCKNIATDEFIAEMAERGWVGWELPHNGVGASPFEDFPDGELAGEITCRWGEDPDLGTDNVTDLAWAPIEPDAAIDTKDWLVDQGYERISAPEGVYLALPGSEGWSDAEGYAQTYLFTDDDVRWAMFKDEVKYVKAPDEQG